MVGYDTGVGLHTESGAPASLSLPKSTVGKHILFVCDGFSPRTRSTTRFTRSISRANAFIATKSGRNRTS